MDQAPASTTNHALEACERMLRPIMRLALDRGLKYQDIDELIRDLMLDEAARDWVKRNGKEPSGSQLSVTTGINRKEVKKRLETDSSAPLLASSMRSLPAQVFSQWRFLVQSDAAAEKLPMDSADASIPTFAFLVKKAGGDVHYRSVLDELVRLKLVQEQNGHAVLVSDAFIPPGPGPELLARCAANTGAHLEAAISNANGQEPPFLERTIWGEGVSLEDCLAIQNIAREQWTRSQSAIYEAMAKMPEQTDVSQRHRVRVGTYVHFEPVALGEKL
jgi:hypothetical protein